MRKLLVIPLLVVLAGCAGTIPNPLTATNIYQTKLVFAATETAADKYRTYCWARPYAVLMTDPIAKTVCKNRRPVARAMASASLRAANAIAAAEDFQTKNPTLSSSTLLSAANSAVAAFSNVTPAVPVP